MSDDNFSQEAIGIILNSAYYYDEGRRLGFADWVFQVVIYELDKLIYLLLYPTCELNYKIFFLWLTHIKMAVNYSVCWDFSEFVCAPNKVKKALVQLQQAHLCRNSLSSFLQQPTFDDHVKLILSTRTSNLLIFFYGINYQ